MQKWMTIDDLYNFCLTQNFNKFNSEESGGEIVVSVPSSFSKTKNDSKHKEGLTPFVSKAFHDHINLNKSQIKEDVFKENLPSTQMRPVLAHIVKTEDGVLDFGSHDMEFIEDENGEQKIKYIEQPVGVICGDYSIEYDEDAKVNRAILNGYLFDGYCQDAIDIINRREEVSCSVELSVRAMSFDVDTKTLILDDYYVTALTLLGENIAPGMAGSNVKLADFSATQSTSDKLVEALEKLSTILENFDLNTEERRTQKVDNEEFNEVTTEETPEAVVEESAEVVEAEAEEVPVVEEAEAETEGEVVETESKTETEVVETESEEIVEEESKKDEDEDFKKKRLCSLEIADKTYSVSLNDTIYAITTLVNDTYGEIDCEWYNCDVYGENEKYVVMHGWSHSYRQSYKVKNGVYSLVGDRIEVHAQYLTDDEIKKLEEMKKDYSLVKDELTSYKNAEMHSAREAVVNAEDYSLVREDDEFKSLVGDMDNYSVEELTNKADLIYARVAKATFANNKPEKKSINLDVTSYEDNSKKPYGGIFEDYYKKKRRK